MEGCINQRKSENDIGKKNYKYLCRTINSGNKQIYIITSLMSLFCDRKRSWGSFVKCSTPDLNIWPQ